MIKVTLKFSSLIILLSLVSCRASRTPVASPAVNGSAVLYIESYRDLAISEMKRTGVPASITLAQGMLESDYGRSTLAKNGNNHFGIKCHSDWNGQTMVQHDDRRNECFRKYQRPEDSFYDHSDFLKTGSRYGFLFNLDPQDYKAWAHGLKRAGYATNPDYANLIIRKIEENNLYIYDKGYTAASAKSGAETPPRPVPVKNGTRVTQPSPAPAQESITFGDVMARAPRILENNRSQYIVVKDGDTREKIEKEFQLLRRDLANYNDLDENFDPVPGTWLYLEPKKDKADTGKEFHTVIAGETMHAISQKYGVKLKSLLEMNRMTADSEPVAGQKIWLQSTKPIN